MPDFIVYLYNENSGVVAWFPSLVAAAELKLPLGWHGPFKTHQEAIDYYNNGKAANPSWKAPNFNIGTAIDNASQTSLDAARKAGADAVKSLDPLAKYDLNSWLLRIGEILLGLVLLGVGIAKLTGTTNMVAKAVKAAI